MPSIQAYCPASLSFIFKACPNKNLVKMGSVGIGCTVNKGVVVSVEKKGANNIFFNGELISFPTIDSVIKSLTLEPVVVQIRSKLPLGYGFGISGASALACAFAINKLFSLKKNRLDLVKIAHVAEILNGTGLGSVGTQATGGFLLKTSPGIPVKAKNFSFVEEIIYATIIDKLETPSILKDKKKLKKVSGVADYVLDKVKKRKSISFSEVIDRSWIFSKKSLLLIHPKVSYLIEKIKEKGGHATMAMLGQVVLSDIDPKNIQKEYRVEKLTITKDRVHLLNKSLVYD